MTPEENSFETRLRTALHNSAQRHDFVIPRPPGQRAMSHPVVSFGLIATIGLLIAGLMYIRNDTDPQVRAPIGRPVETDPRTESSWPSLPAPALVELEAGSRGAELSPPTLSGVRRPTPTYWFGAIEAPSGGIVTLSADILPPPPVRSEDQPTMIAGLNAFTRSANGVTVTRILLDCGNVTFTSSPQVSPSEHDELLRNVEPAGDRGLRITTPAAWISFGGGVASPSVSRTLTVDDAGTIFVVRLNQQFLAPPGSRATEPALRAFEQAGRRFLVLSETSTTASVVTSIDGDAVTLTGALPAERLAELAALLQPGPTYPLPEGYQLPNDPAALTSSCPVTVAARSAG